MTERILAALLALFFATPVIALPQRTPEDFANAFVRAERSGNAALRLALLHPKSRACITPQTRPYFDWIFTRRQRLAAAGNTTPRAQVEPLAGAARAQTDGRSDYPVIPSHRLTVDVSPSDTRNVAIVLAIVRDGGGWLEVLPCPRPDAVAGALRSDVDATQQARRVHALVDEMPAPLRSEIESLARAGKRIDAMTRYRHASSEDLRTAKDVVDLLVPR